MVYEKFKKKDKEKDEYLVLDRKIIEKKAMSCDNYWQCEPDHKMGCYEIKSLIKSQICKHLRWVDARLIYSVFI